MIELYTSATPNGYKPLIMLEETGLPYKIQSVNLGKGEQLQPDYLAINPNGKIPAIVDRETGVTVFESGAILIYLAEKTGQFLPVSTPERSNVLQWLMFQMASIGPMFGQLNHFNHNAPDDIPYAIRRYETEVTRLCQVLDRQLATQSFVAGDYSIADMAIYPWIAIVHHLDIRLNQYPNLEQWFTQLQQRESVKQAFVALS